MTVMKNTFFKIIFSFIFLLVSLFYQLQAYPYSTESSMIKKIKISSGNGDTDSLKKNVSLFLKIYPRSSFVPSAKLLLADNTPDKEKSLRLYKTFISESNPYKLKAYAQFKICSIYYFNSSWSNLETESIIGIQKFNKSEYYYDFVFFKAKSLFHKQNYSQSYALSSSIISFENKFYFYPEAKLLHDYLQQKLGSNNSYGSNLLFNFRHFKDTGIDISSLYLLGRHYEYKKDYSKAYSIYTDIIKKYPKSPEAKYSKERLPVLKKYHPIYSSSYLNDNFKDDQFLNISPEIEITDTQNKNYYCIEIAPFYNLKECKKLSMEIKQNFSNVFIVRKKRYFSIYIGKITDSENALNYRIRLAEEYGLNGNIIFVTDSSGIQYYYGD